MAAPGDVQKVPDIAHHRIADYIFSRKERACHSLCDSDLEALRMREVVDMMDADTRQQWEELVLGYTDKRGSADLRSEIARLYKVGQDDILVVTGSEGIFLGITCMTSHLLGKYSLRRLHVVATSPAFQSLHEDAMRLGSDVDEWMVKYTDDGWKFDVEDFKKLIKENTKLLIVNFPHNPTSFSPTASDWQEIIDVCKSREIHIFSDEIYTMSNHDGSEGNQSACVMYENAVTMNSLSKMFGLPATRIGWVISRNGELMDMMRKFRCFLSLCPSRTCELLAVSALRGLDKLRERNLGILRENIVILTEFLSRHKDVLEWHPPKCGTIAFVKIKGWGMELGSGKATGFCDALLNEFGVLLLPGEVMGYKPDDSVRIGFCRRNIEEGLKLLGQFLDKYRPKATEKGD